MTDDSTLPSTKPQPSPPLGVSGKRVIAWIVTALLAIGVALGFTLWNYNRLDVVRADSAAAWRATTHALDGRYRVAEQQIANGVHANAVTADFQQRFELAVDRFRTTSIMGDQVAAAEQVEQLLGSEDFPTQMLQANPPTEQLLNQLDEYNQQRLRERVLRESFGGKILEMFLTLPPSAPFHVSSVP